MKLDLSIPTLLLLALVATVCTSPAQRLPPTPAPPAAIPETPAGPAKIEVSVEDIRRNRDDVRQKVDDARRQVERARAQFDSLARISPKGPPTPSLYGGYGGSFSPADQPLIVSSESLEPPVMDMILEDMRIMGKLLDDSLAATDGDSADRRAMGIVVRGFPDAGPRNLFIVGHGAVFQTSVDFPLAPPPGGPKKDASNTPHHSAWEAARRELSGANDEFDPNAPPAAGREFSVDKVDGLKRAVLKAIANANNFRNLADDETVTVVIGSNASRGAVMFARPVNGGLPAGMGMGGGSSGGGGGMGGFGGVGGSPNPAPPSTMTITVKKSDATALADGRIKQDEFRDRAKIAVY